jgi:Lrp/AsnC family leucine-responsive transcriptional regulator
MKQLDKIDKKILNSLLADSRIPHTKIAKECGVSSPTISNRVNKMKKKGLIVKEFLFLNMETLGYKVVALIGINLKIENEKNIREILRNQVLVLGFDYTVGKYDVCALAVGKHFDELDQLKNTLRKQQGVTEVDIHIFNKLHFVRDNVPVENLGV